MLKKHSKALFSNIFFNINQIYFAKFWFCEIIYLRMAYLLALGDFVLTSLFSFIHYLLLYTLTHRIIYYKHPLNPVISMIWAYFIYLDIHRKMLLYCILLWSFTYTITIFYYRYALILFFHKLPIRQLRQFCFLT